MGEVLRQKYLVAFSVKHGEGRTFITAHADIPMCENLILAFEQYLTGQGHTNPLVLNVIPLETFWQEWPDDAPSDNIPLVYGAHLATAAAWDQTQGDPA